jgi:hypothetical protein
MLHEGDDIAAPLAAAAVPNLLAGVDCESVGAAALRAWSAALGPAAVQFDTAPPDFILNADGAGLRDPVATEQIARSLSQIHATDLEWRGAFPKQMNAPGGEINAEHFLGAGALIQSQSLLTVWSMISRRTAGANTGCPGVTAVATIAVDITILPEPVGAASKTARAPPAATELKSPMKSVS